jgi:hypothetical protein
MMKKVVFAILLQIVLMKDVALSESNRDNSTQTAASANLTESTTPHSPLDNSTISAVDKNSTETSNVTVSTTTTTTEDPLIPVATVEAQIIKANISTKKPSRLQAQA